MAFPRKYIRSCSIAYFILNFLLILKASASFKNIPQLTQSSHLENKIDKFFEKLLNGDNVTVIPGVLIQRSNESSLLAYENENEELGRSNRGESTEPNNYEGVSKSHVVSIYIPEAARFLTSAESGKSSFMAGFGMGFLAFALKKLLLPLIFGAQVIKSLLIILFLPSLVGSLGKLLGKGLSTVSGISGASGLAQNTNNNQVIEDFDFKEMDPYQNEGALQDVNNVDNSISATNDLESSTAISAAANRLGTNQRVAYVPYRSEDYYLRKPPKQTDFKVFHKIPNSTLLLSTYDPFYSPLLSRLDIIFQQLGLGNDKSPETERCRERLVCMMYANPAKFAPYSNLVSVQLSRELNELKKPSSDNPEILRFFRYMKAARDGQDGEECLAHVGCPALMKSDTRPALLTVYNEINKLVHARKL